MVGTALALSGGYLSTKITPEVLAAFGEKVPFLKNVLSPSEKGVLSPSEKELSSLSAKSKETKAQREEFLQEQLAEAFHRIGDYFEGLELRGAEIHERPAINLLSDENTQRTITRYQNTLESLNSIYIVREPLRACVRDLGEGLNDKNRDRAQIIAEFCKAVDDTRHLGVSEHSQQIFRDGQAAREARVAKSNGTLPATPGAKPDPTSPTPPAVTPDPSKPGAILSSIDAVIAKDLRDFIDGVVKLEKNHESLLKSKGFGPLAIQLDSKENLVATFDKIATRMKAIRDSLPASDLTDRPAASGYQDTFSKFRDAWQKGETEGLQKFHELFNE